MNEILVSDDVKLVQVKKEMAEELFSLVDKNRQILREHLPWVDATRSIESIKDFIRFCEEKLKNKNVPEYAIMVNGQPVGMLGVHSIDQTHRWASIGYWLDTNHQGQGLMQRCVKALITYLFSEKDLNRIQINVGTNNKKSQRIPEALGFQKEGHLRQVEWINDHFVDHYVYGLLRSDCSKKS